MIVISEEVALAIVGLEDAIGVVEGAFLALHAGTAEIMPVVAGAGFGEGQRWALKSARSLADRRIGCKLGSYWPGNPAAGLAAHGSTVILLDPETGHAQAIVQATGLTALRTAAADAVAVKYLAREDAATLAIIGAGHQAWYDMRAICLVRPITSILVAGRDRAKARAFADRAQRAGYPASALSLRDAVSQADIIATITPSRRALFDADWVGTGVHISAMGADDLGKQELPVALVERAVMFADSTAQSTTIGEFEAAFRAGLCTSDDIIPLGAVIAGTRPGRRRAEDITLFDSSGMAVQDLAICGLAVEKARASQLGVEL